MYNRVKAGVVKEIQNIYNRKLLLYLGVGIYVFIGFFLILALEGKLAKNPSINPLEFTALAENILLLIPIFFGLALTHPISIELYFNERWYGSFEMLLTTPMTLREIWLSKTLVSALNGIYAYIATMLLLILIILAIFPHVFMILSTINILTLLISISVASMTSLMYASIIGYLYFITNNMQLLNILIMLVSVALMFPIFYFSKYFANVNILVTLLVLLLLFIIVLCLLYFLVGRVRNEKLVLS